MLSMPWYYRVVSRDAASWKASLQSRTHPGAANRLRSTCATVASKDICSNQTVTFLSQKYSLGRAVQALREYERRHNHTHSMVVMTRPDLLLFGRGLLLSDSARFPPDEVSHWADYYFVTSSRIAQRFGELYHRCWRDDLQRFGRSRLLDRPGLAPRWLRAVQPFLR